MRHVLTGLSAVVLLFAASSADATDLHPASYWGAGDSQSATDDCTNCSGRGGRRCSGNCESWKPTCRSCRGGFIGGHRGQCGRCSSLVRGHSAGCPDGDCGRVSGLIHGGLGRLGHGSGTTSPCASGNCGHGTHTGAHGPGYGYGYPHGFMGPSGPPVGTYAYPYYTIRGPRDFFMNNPPSIGR